MSIWKLLLAGGAFGVALNIALTDFGETDAVTYGVKAVLLAMIGVSALFVSLVPRVTNRSARTTNLDFGVVGVFASGLASWFWLLKVTGGNLAPYLVDILAAIGLSVLLLILALLLRYWYEEERVRESGEAEQNLRTLAKVLIEVLARWAVAGSALLALRWLL